MSPFTGAYNFNSLCHKIQSETNIITGNSDENLPKSFSIEKMKSEIDRKFRQKSQEIQKKIVLKLPLN
jgi:hypothetical protein